MYSITTQLVLVTNLCCVTKSDVLTNSLPDCATVETWKFHTQAAIFPYGAQFLGLLLDGGSGQVIEIDYCSSSYSS